MASQANLLFACPLTCRPASIMACAAARQDRYWPEGSSSEKVRVEPCRLALQWWMSIVGDHHTVSRPA